MTEIDQGQGPGRKCPVIGTDYRIDRPIFWNYQSLNEVREQAPIVWNTSAKGFWMINRYEEAKEALRMDDVFSNAKVNAFDPDMQLRLLPQTLNGDQHRKFRALLNPWFSPGAVKRLDPLSRTRCAGLVSDVRPLGGCDFVTDFAILYPTEIFLTLIGLPVSDGPAFLKWVEAIFGGFHSVDPAAADRAVADVTAYFEAAVEDRQKSPRDPATDFVSYMLQAELDGQRLPHEDIVTTCLTIMLAGLDTTRSALSYIWNHLAAHDDVRRRMRRNRVRRSSHGRFLRLYSLLIQDGRLVTRDIEFHGCPMRAGDMISVGIISANRDPRKFDRPDEFFPERGSTRTSCSGSGPAAAWACIWAAGNWLSPSRNGIHGYRTTGCKRAPSSQSAAASCRSRASMSGTCSPGRRHAALAAGLPGAQRTGLGRPDCGRRRRHDPHL